MLSLVAYDIADPKRLARCARVCEDYGVRVQYSLFECRLEHSEFADFWLQLLAEIDETEDRLVAYQIDARAAKETEPRAPWSAASKSSATWYDLIPSSQSAIQVTTSMPSKMAGS